MKNYLVASGQSIVIIVIINICSWLDGNFPDYKMNIALIVLIIFIILGRKLNQQK